jgi:hypothetical protein
VAELTEIRWHGRGGQGVVTAGKLLAETALGTGQYFQAFPDYGPERMGAPIRAFTRLSTKPITIHSQIEQPNVVLVLDPTLLGTVPVTEGLPKDGPDRQGVHRGRQPHRHRGDGAGHHQHTDAGSIRPRHRHFRHRRSCGAVACLVRQKDTGESRRGQRPGDAPRGRRSATRVGGNQWN